VSLRLVTAPSTYPITMAEARAQCGIYISDTTHDAKLSPAYFAAINHVEKVLGRALMAQTWELVLDSFSDTMKIPLAPVQSITSVKYYDADDALQTLSTDCYVFDGVSNPQAVVRAPDASWPEVADGINKVIIRFVANYTTVPEAVKFAILVLVRAWFDNPADPVPPAVDALLWPNSDLLV
jgi:uncharacterized phiE125 gp8 family phage protein